jgi:hypothetical protein
VESSCEFGIEPSDSIKYIFLLSMCVISYRDKSFITLTLFLCLIKQREESVYTLILSVIKYTSKSTVTLNPFLCLIKHRGNLDPVPQINVFPYVLIYAFLYKGSPDNPLM